MIRLSEIALDDGRAMLQRARDEGWEGLIVKDGQSRVSQRQADAGVAQDEAPQAAGVRRRRLDRAAADANAFRLAAARLLRRRTARCAGPAASAPASIRRSSSASGEPACSARTRTSSPFADAFKTIERAHWVRPTSSSRSGSPSGRATACCGSRSIWARATTRTRARCRARRRDAGRATAQAAHAGRVVLDERDRHRAAHGATPAATGERDVRPGTTANVTLDAAGDSTTSSSDSTSSRTRARTATSRCRTATRCASPTSRKVFWPELGDHQGRAAPLLRRGVAAAAAGRRRPAAGDEAVSERRRQAGVLSAAASGDAAAGRAARGAAATTSSRSTRKARAIG